MCWRRLLCWAAPADQEGLVGFLLGVATKPVEKPGSEQGWARGWGGSHWTPALLARKAIKRPHSTQSCNSLDSSTSQEKGISPPTGPRDKCFKHWTLLHRKQLSGPCDNLICFAFSSLPNHPDIWSSLALSQRLPHKPAATTAAFPSATCTDIPCWGYGWCHCWQGCHWQLFLHSEWSIPAQEPEGEAKGLGSAKQVQNKYVVHSRLCMVKLGSVFERCLHLRAPVSHPGSPLDTAAPRQLNLKLVQEAYVRNPYATCGVYLPSGLWVESG